MGSEASETITLSDPIGSIYQKKLVIEEDMLVDACLTAILPTAPGPEVDYGQR